MKRFWDTAAIAPHADGFGVTLDGRPLRLPGGSILRVAPATLAEAIAAEWQAAGGAKGGEMSFADTPLTRLAGTAQERIAPRREANIASLAAYAETDLLCYRAETPRALARRQAEHWQPWLDWASLTYDAPLRATTGIVHVAQDPQSLAALRAALAAQDTLILAGLGILVPALGSLVLGLAVAAGELDGAQAHRLGCLDELFQEELWGMDTEAQHRRAAVAADIAMAARFITLAQG